MSDSANGRTNGRIPRAVPQSFFAIVMAFLSVGLVGASCDKKSSASPEPANAGDPRAEEAAAAAKAMEHTGDAEDKTPIPGLDLSQLKESDRERFDKLVNTLASPCGDARSLRKAAAGEGDCKRAPFAARYVMEMLTDGASDTDVRELYGLAYRNLDKKVSFKLSDEVPHVGPTDARVIMVEFFDYGCPACKQFKPLLKMVTEAFPQDVCLYYKQYPLPGHADSDEAAAAALAANAQGKFDEMHELLFDDQYSHKMKDLEGYAKKLGLDMKKFEADFAKAVERVAADRAEGGDHVQGTPTLFINGRVYEGPAAPKYLKLFVEEELAVNQ